MRSRLFLFGRSLSLLCWVTLLFVGCQKEDGAKRFSIFTESYRGTAKVVVDGLSSSWRAGDSIWVNGVQGSVALDNNGAPILNVSVTNWEGGYYASYPASSVVAGARDGTLTLTLPQAYQYREDATTHKQLLEMPMVAYTVNDRLEFKHLTGALVVKVPSVSSNIRLDYIMVHSSTSPLSGTGTVNAMDNSPAMVFGSDTTHTVVMYFDRCTVDIAAGAAEKSIMIPVAPTTGNDHKFTVTVCAHTTGSTRTYYFFNKESSVGNISRNEVAVAEVPSLSLRIIPLVGEGSDVSPYLIQNKVDYKNFLYCISKGDSNDGWYKLFNDIDFGGDTVTAVTFERGFYGKFNGNSKQLTDVAVIGSTYSSYHFISLFPAITGGWVKNLFLSNVRLIAPRSGSYNSVCIGGFSSYVKSFNAGVSLENIYVSNMDYDYTTTSLSIKQLSFGCIVGKVVNGSNGSCNLTMTSCRANQVIHRNYFYPASTITLGFGGLIGDVENTTVTLTDCQVHLGGSLNQEGITINSSTSSPYFGSAIGHAKNNTTQIVNSLVLSGYVQFIGNNNSYVKRIIGSGSTINGASVVNASGLFLWKRKDMSNPNNEVREDY